MKHIYRIILEFSTEYNLTNDDVQLFFNKQWKQTAASGEGDEILIKSIKKIEEESLNKD